jgi:hypothetical protein
LNGLSGELAPVHRESTPNLKARVHGQFVGVRRLVEVEPTDHPLAVEQRQGIAWERVEEIARLLHQAQA